MIIRITTAIRGNLVQIILINAKVIEIYRLLVNIHGVLDLIKCKYPELSHPKHQNSNYSPSYAFKDLVIINSRETSVVGITDFFDVITRRR